MSAEAQKDRNPKDLLGVGKPPMSTVSQLVLMEVGVAMLEGAEKYGRHNYRAVGVRSSVYYDAAMRHLNAWWEGQDTDPQSGMHHVTKAITSLVVLRDAMLMGMVTDDRPPVLEGLDEFLKDLEDKVKHIKSTYGHMVPTHYTMDSAGAKKKE